MTPQEASEPGTDSYVIGLYGSGMHDYVIRELEIGPRAALVEDMEACGYTALDPDPESEPEIEAGL